MIASQRYFFHSYIIFHISIFLEFRKWKYILPGYKIQTIGFEKEELILIGLIFTAVLRINIFWAGFWQYWFNKMLPVFVQIQKSSVNICGCWLIHCTMVNTMGKYSHQQKLYKTFYHENILVLARHNFA